ncbi:hypothetical protein [Pseudomonas sp.]|uniref:hypothetical protein n=1 Tax=Pseudomonas sp. TaxID=306 RepID=UPI00261D5698|nr:hypothetical protein [Pseudomonas sp.]
MEKIVSKEFESYREAIKANLPSHSRDFECVDLYFDPSGGEYGNGDLRLVDSGNLDEPIYSTSSGHGIKRSDIDKYHAKTFARIMFLDRVSKALTHDDVASYFARIIRLAHNDVRIHQKPDRIEIIYHSLQLMARSSIFTVSPDLMKFVVIKDHVNFEDVKVSIFERTVTYYSKNSDAHVVNRGGVVGALFYGPAFSHSTKLYVAAFGASINSIVTIVDLLSDEDKSIAFRLSRRLLDIPLSKGKAYEDVLNELLAFIFSNCYEEVEMHVQVPNEERLRVRDIVIDNRDPENNFLNLLKDNGVHYLLMDAKNYKGLLRVRDVDTFIGYIGENKKFGGFGIILSRKGASKTLKKQLVKKLAQGIEIVVLDEADVLDMIDLRALDRDPMSVIKDKLKQLHFQQ